MELHGQEGVQRTAEQIVKQVVEQFGQEGAQSTVEHVRTGWR